MNKCIHKEKNEVTARHGGRLAEICLNKCPVARRGGAVASGELSKVLPWGSMN